MPVGALRFIPIKHTSTVWMCIQRALPSHIIHAMNNMPVDVTLLKSPGIRIGRCLALPQTRQFFVGSEEVCLGGRAFDLLMALVERRGRLVSKEELYGLIWPGVAVEPNNLQVQIWTLRRLLGTDAIKTVVRRGYQLAVSVEVTSGFAPLGPWIDDPTASAVRLAAESLPALARQLARRLAKERWLTLSGSAHTLRRQVCEATCQAFVDASGVTVWRWPAEGVAIRPVAIQSILRRLRRVGGVLIVPQAGHTQREEISRWVVSSGAADLLCILVATADADPAAFPGEAICALPWPATAEPASDPPSAPMPLRLRRHERERGGKEA
jgi:DNA-binding winged helix-turn-helix (wHTH) protein